VPLPQVVGGALGRAIADRTYGALMHCAKLEQARSLIRVGQIAEVSSSKAAATRSGVGSSTRSS
jgi:hypothetical protein